MNELHGETDDLKDEVAPELSESDSGEAEVTEQTPETAAAADDVSGAEVDTTEVETPGDVAAEVAAGVDSPSAKAGAGTAADTGEVQPLELIEDDEDPENLPKDWYILKVQSNRERSIADALRRRVKVEGLDAYFEEIIVPTEDVAEFKNGKKKIVKRKLYPGYIVVNMAINDDTWFLVRETPGIGDFTGTAGKPTPMLPHEVDKIVSVVRPAEPGDEPTFKTVIPFKVGAQVRVKEGTFENFEGEVSKIDEAKGGIEVIIDIFGRSTQLELEHWQVEEV